ncbi:MAG TPA: rhomboid family intramembrane serine protease [Caldisericia bacterium]|nr:rhomboid family intramembrane serine protease [Caldisericia bacterium]HOL82950.1 rhomboid family intramembrane serine protease [Caldisericia bacterium]HPC56534.1 rhomboid family intramembrane serine protease [Caldisericia bacterium]HPP42984.1 rhomboid family intramembrane serine protease [Caldisericia bacterium]
MIPISDINPRRKFPYITTSLIIINVVIFIYQSTLKNPELFIYKYALIPSNLFKLGGFEYIKLITSTFLHGNLFHLIGNMLYLWIFGDNVENRLGTFKYTIFYLLVGIISGMTHALIYASSGIPTIGASGAIAGVLGAYFYLFPNAKVLALVPIFYFFTIIPVSAYFFLGIWFILQLIPGFINFGKAGAGVAFWAHIGGFLGGIILVILFGEKRKETYYEFYG